MESNGNNIKLTVAKKNKMDEFYTQLTDIEKELVHYKEHFNGKVVFCNCDDPRESNFWKYFSLNFKHLGLKKLISTHFSSNTPSYKLEMVSMEQLPIQTPLKENGDFRSQECIDILKEVDIVVTNPPFSLFREYISQLVEYNKKFVVMGNMNAITYKESFKLIKENKMWLGYSIHSGDREFKVPNNYVVTTTNSRVDSDGNKYVRVNGIRWFTNLDHNLRHEELILYRNYNGNKNEYPIYDNYDAININKTVEIPRDYNGAMGVPISFLDKYNPEQFEIISSNDIRKNNVPFKEHGLIKDKDGTINGNATYVRIVIKNRKVQS